VFQHFKFLIIVILGLLSVAPLHCFSAEPAVIAIIIDDIGNNLEAGKRVINSNLPVTCSILPARPHSIKLARLAHKNGKEVMLHLPMQASKSERLGLGGLTMGMSKREFTRTVEISIDAIPYASGINNHMGSLLTSNQDHMEWLMQAIANRDEHLFFVDSRTTAKTVASDAAHSYYIPNVQRDVFLDDTAHDKSFVKQQIEQLIKIAKKQGYALAIGHPHKTTLSVLEEELSKLPRQDVQLVTVSELINTAISKNMAGTYTNLNKRATKWQKYSSLSLKAVKN
jgi:polysaccharide deacetylase 2 family uncharacterized protein YibQ